MALLLLILLLGTFIFIFYYELIWKKFERANGRSFVWATKDFFFGSNLEAVPASSPWKDWKYRTLVELHRRDRLYPAEVAKLVGVSVEDMERYFDTLTAEGKAQSAGDAERGIFYKAVSPHISSLLEGETHVASTNFPQARGFE